MANLIHSSGYKPRIFPIQGDVDDAEIDRVQSIDPTVTTNREEVNEVGRDEPVGYSKTSPEVSYSLTALEHGSLEFWQKLANTSVKGNIGQDEIDLNDFKNSYFDICGYLEDDNETVVGTALYQSLRTNGFSLNISEPQARIERTFDLVGERAKILQGDNKYYIYVKHTAGSASDDEIDLSARTPAEDPNNSGVYMLRVVRVRSGETTELESTDYSYNDGTEILTINSIQSGDVIKVYYSSATAPATTFTKNDTDPATILGDSVSIYLYVPASGKPGSTDYVYRLQSVSIDVSFDREDLREIGNKNVVQRGITDKTVTVTLGRMVEDFTIEEILNDKAEDFGILDVNDFSDEIALIIKIYSDNDKGTFKYGFKATGLTPTDVGLGVSVNEYLGADTTLEGNTLIISADTSKIGI